jgi:hypothetical protein
MNPLEVPVRLFIPMPEFPMPRLLVPMPIEPMPRLLEFIPSPEVPIPRPLEPIPVLPSPLDPKLFMPELRVFNCACASKAIPQSVNAMKDTKMAFMEIPAF